MRNEQYHPDLAPRRPPYLVVLPLATVIVIALVWSGLWYLASHTAQDTLAGWREREAAVGRIHTCGKEAISGYPFRIELRCTDPSVEMKTLQPAMTIRAKDIMVVAQVWDPTLLISEVTGPLSFGQSGQPAMAAAEWMLAQSSLRGLPNAPERISLVFDKPAFTQATVGGSMQEAFRAEHMELHGRIAPGSASGNAVVDLALTLVKATAPNFSAYMRAPIDADITATLSGIKDLKAKPWAERLRDMQAADGRIDVQKARISQGDVVALVSGTLKLNIAGRLDGEMQVTIANIEGAITALGIDKILQERGGNANQMAQNPNSRLSQFAPALGNLDKQMPGLANSLDKISPGLGGLARGNTNGGIAALVRTMGTPTELDGKPAVKLPLRFRDGRASLGIIPLGEVPALY